MAIPGYDSGDVAEFALERAGAHIAIVAGVVPDEFGLERSVREPPADALTDPIDLVGIDDLRAVEAFRIELLYDPAALPPGASPTDVAVAVETGVASETQRADGDSAEQSSADHSSGLRGGETASSGTAKPSPGPREEAVDDDGWEPLESTVDLEETTVTAVMNDRPRGSTIVAINDSENKTTDDI